MSTDTVSPSPIQPYLFFDGRCEEALEFYRKALGAELEMLMRYKESPDSLPPEAHAEYGEKILHASLRLGGSLLMMSDDCTGHPTFKGVSLAYSAADEKEAKQKFDALADGGTVQMPLSPTFFSPSFGMLTDRFGLSWMISVPMPRT